MNPNIFRAYDIRGIADRDVTDDTVEAIGRAYGTVMIRKKRKKISVGGDVRLTTERIKKALIKGVLSTGLDVIDFGVVPTPVLYFSIAVLKTDGCVMVTGSHNPIEYNGLKINDGLLSLFGEDILALRDLVGEGDVVTGRGELFFQDIVPQYKDFLKKNIRIGRPLKIVIDSGNGTAGPIAPEVYQALGCKVICLFCEPD